MKPQTDINKELVLTFIRLVEQNEFGAAFDQIVAETYNDHLEGQQPGRENLKNYLRTIKSAFPDLRWPVQFIVAENDLVVVYNGIEATHEGDFGPFKASGNSVNVMAFQLYRVENNKLAEHWELADFVKLQQQLSS